MNCDGRLTHIHEHPEIGERDLRLIRAHLPGARTILDVGAGRGGFVRQAIQAGFRALALDCEPDVQAIWRREGVRGVLGDAFNPPLRLHSFDVVRAKEIVEHVHDPLTLVRAMRSLLTPEGILLAHVPSPYSQLYPVGNFWDDYTHVRPFSRLGLQRLVEDGGMTLRYVRGYTAGRSPIERLLAGALSRVLPHTYVVVAQVPPTPASLGPGGG